MTQIFIFGGSIVYGVGAQESGWADLIKRKLHSEMYGRDGSGEKYELYNFGKPGATTDFVLKTFDQQIEYYNKFGKKIVILSIGLNNTKAEDTPENYVSSVVDYKKQMEELLLKIHSRADHVLCIGYMPVDEKKTLPKTSTLRKGVSYFWNKRIQVFNNVFADVCSAHAIPFVNISIDPDVWNSEYLYKDGLHPNQKGHQFLFESIYHQLEKLL